MRELADEYGRLCQKPERAEGNVVRLIRMDVKCRSRAGSHCDASQPHCGSHTGLFSKQTGTVNPAPMCELWGSMIVAISGWWVWWAKVVRDVVH
jgi:hypothetical protein